MDEQIDVAGCEDEAAAELKRMLTDRAAADTGLHGPLARASVVAAKQVEGVSDLQFDRFVGLPSGIDEQRKVDALFLPEGLCVAHVAHAHRGDSGSGGLDLLLCVANPRDVLPAEDSAVVAQENDDGRPDLPQRPQANDVHIGIGQLDFGQALGKRPSHAPDGIADSTGGERTPTGRTQPPESVL